MASAPVPRADASGLPAIRRARYRSGLLPKTPGIELDCGGRAGCPASTGNEIRRASLFSARRLIILGSSIGSFVRWDDRNTVPAFLVSCCFFDPIYGSIDQLHHRTHDRMGI